MTLLRMSIQAGILIIGIVLIRALGMNKLPKKGFLILWDIVLIKLLVPLSFPAKWSILTFFNELQKDLGKTSASVHAEINIAMADFGILPLEQLIASKTTISPSLMMSVWIVGMVTFGVVFSVFIFKDYQELRFSIPVTNAPTITEWQSTHALYRPLRILQSDRITTPLAVGIISPRIILPKTMDLNNTQSISYVLTHEYFHLRRFDMLRKVFVLCAVCVHWFNPLVWVMSILLNRDLEMTCDEAVLKHFGANKTTKKEYVYALIKIAEARNAYSPIRSYFSTNSAEERIISIMKYKKASCLSVVMAALLLVCFTNMFVAFACEAPFQTNYAEPYSTELLTTSGKVISRSINDSINSNYTDTRIDNTSFYGETVNCINGISGPHEESNAHMATYTNNGGTWSLKSGQTVMITLDVVPVENAEDGWSVYLGYQKDGNYTIVSNPRIFIGSTTLPITIPEDGEYNFFILNVSAGKISISSSEINIG